MKVRQTVGELARELGVHPADVIHYAQANQLPLRRVAAVVTEGQAYRFREAHKAGQLRRRTANAPVLESVRPSDETRIRRCSCCEQKFSYRVRPGETDPEYCRDCREHYPRVDETSERALARATDHAERWMAYGRKAAAKATEYEDRMKAALRSRDKWKRTLAEVMVAHGPKDDDDLAQGCACGQEWPCVTRRTLTAVNRGIAGQVEALESLPQDEFEKFLYGDDSYLDDWDFAYSDEPEPNGR